MLWGSMEASRRDASNEYPQHMFSRRIEKTSDPNTPYLGLNISKFQ